MKQLVLDIGVAAGPTMENFLVAGNRQAWQHVQGMLDAPAQPATPVYLWGEQGTGKSHLLRAAVQALGNAGARVGWMDAGVADPGAFDEAWDAVALDDVHRYDARQQAAAFNWFINAGNPASGAARLVLAAGRLPPADLPLREDLRSRLGWGHVFRLEALHEAQCRQVLQRQAAQRGIALSAEVLEYMRAHFARDLGSQMRLLERLDRFALRTQRLITLALLRAMLQDEPIAAETP